VARPRFKILLSLLAAALIILSLAILLDQFLYARPDLAEVYSRYIFPWLTTPWLIILGRIPFSFSELFVVGSFIAIIALLVVGLRKLITVSEWRLLRFLRSLIIVIIVLSLLVTNIIFFYRLNFNRYSLADSLDLELKPRAKGELVALANWLAEEAAQIREQLPEDEKGVLTLTGGYRQILAEAYLGYDSASQEYPLLATGLAVKPKPMLLSSLWSYTGIIGMYMPLFVEANINIDQPAHNIPFTALHEIAHTKGFAREEDVNFAAFLAGLYHPDPVFRYSALVSAWRYVSNRVYGEDPDLYARLIILSPGMRRDIEAQTLYWRKYEGKVERISTRINDALLQANRQEDGVKSYGRMVDLVLAWFDKEQIKLLR